MESFINNSEIPKLQALWPFDHQTTAPVLIHVFLFLQSSTIWDGEIIKGECCSFKKSTHTLLVMERQTGDGHCHLLFNNKLFMTLLTHRVDSFVQTLLTTQGERVLCNSADTQGWQYWEGEFCATRLTVQRDREFCATLLVVRIQGEKTMCNTADTQR